MSEQATEDLLDAVRDRLARSGGEVSPARVAEALRYEGRPVGDAEVLAVHDLLRRDVLGAGPLEELLALEGVTDVLVNGADEVWIDRGRGLELSGVRFLDEGTVRRLAQRLAGLGGRRLDDATPFVDLRLPDGTRFHAVLAPVARPGTLVSLRVPSSRVLDLEGFQEAGSVDEEGAALLRRIIEARLAFLVSGGTGSGKTTLLGALLSLVDPDERIVLVEDASELRPQHPHVVALEARPPNIENAGAISLRTLVRQALRMRPDRLVLGEVRGAEAPHTSGNQRGSPRSTDHLAGRMIAIQPTDSSSTANRCRSLTRCPARRGIAMVNTSTGVVVPASCHRLSCRVCVRVMAFRYSRAIGTAHPANQFLLTQVGDDWATIRERLNRFRRAARRHVDRWEDVVHVEPNPSGTGHHLHGWQWGGDLDPGQIADLAARAGMGPFADIAPRALELGAPLTYGLKTVLMGSDRGPTLPEATQAFLETNGGRLGHATPGFWRDLEGNPLKGVREAMKAPIRDGNWALVPDPRERSSE